jgi:hypothetical protein
LRQTLAREYSPYNVQNNRGDAKSGQIGALSAIFKLRITDSAHEGAFFYGEAGGASG